MNVVKIVYFDLVYNNSFHDLRQIWCQKCDSFAGKFYFKLLLSAIMHLSVQILIKKNAKIEKFHVD